MPVKGGTSGTEFLIHLSYLWGFQAVKQPVITGQVGQEYWVCSEDKGAGTPGKGHRCQGAQ